MRALGRSGDIRGVLKVLEQLENDDLVKPDAFAYNCVLETCISNGDSDAVESIYTRMRDLNMLDIMSFNIMIKGHTRPTPPDLTAACSLLQSMRALNISPNEVSYSSIIGAAVGIDRMELVWDLIDEMERSGVPVSRPNFVPFQLPSFRLIVISAVS